MLGELAEIGMDVARAAGKRALAAMEAPAEEAAAPGAVDPALSFTRVARTVRMTLALDSRLEDAHLAREERRQAQAAEQAKEAVRKRVRNAKREGVDIVRRAVEVAGHEDWNGLPRDVEVRFESDRYDEDFAELALPEALARVVRTIGLQPDWSFWPFGDADGEIDPNVAAEVMADAIAQCLGPELAFDPAADPMREPPPREARAPP
jgi:hypothetical protein